MYYKCTSCTEIFETGEMPTGTLYNYEHVYVDRHNRIWGESDICPFCGGPYLGNIDSLSHAAVGADMMPSWAFGDEEGMEDMTGTNIRRR